MEKDTSENKKIAIIGTGHMGQALLEGLAHINNLNLNNIIVANPSRLKPQTLRKHFGVQITTDNKKACIFADWIFITVKPFSVKQVVSEIKDTLSNKLILSVAAGVDIRLLAQYLGSNKKKIIRIMPNIPVSQNQGIVGMYANKNVSTKELKSVTSLLSSLGEIIKVEKEQDLDTFTLLSGCGPAVVAYFINFLLRYGQENGLSYKDALKVALKTFEGTLIYLRNKKITPSILQDSVATKGGVTEAILVSFDRATLNKSFDEAMTIGRLKIKEFKRKLPT